MNKVSFEDIGAVTATFIQGEGVVAGQVVKVTKNGEVGPCSDGDAFCGVALAGRRGFCAVQVKGFLTVPITSPVTLGCVELAADGKGGVKTAEGGVAALVVSVDEGGQSAVICL